MVQHAVNHLSQSVLGRKLTPYTPLQKYTGELLRVEYLFSQTGKVLQNYILDPDGPEAEQLKIIDDDGHDDKDDEGFAEDDMIEDQTIALVEPLAVPSTATESTSTTTTSTTTPSTTTTTTLRPQLVSIPDVSTDIEEPSREFLESLKSHMKAVHPTVTSTAGPSQEMPATPTLEPEEHETPTEDTSPDEFVGPDNISGYDRVEALAEFLVQLKTGTSPLNNQQAEQIISLWNRLHPYDRRPTTFPPRFKNKPVQGRFKQTKKTGVAPGVESTKRCFLGQNAGPAQWPDCNRYVECVISKLCDWFPSRERSSEKRITLRWTLICRAYKNIRSKIINNAKVMEATSMQLVEINQTTLTQWYNRRAKKHERDILHQGLSHVQPPVQTTETLPAAMEKPSLPVPQVVQPFIFTLPPNTAGQAKVSKAAQLKAPVCFVISQEQKVAQTEEESLPKITRWYQKKKTDKGAVPRKYIKKADVITCKKCGKPREKHNHSQYFGNWFCAETADISYEDWRAALVQKGYKKKKTE